MCDALSGCGYERGSYQALGRSKFISVERQLLADTPG